MFHITQNLMNNFICPTFCWFCQKEISLSARSSGFFNSATCLNHDNYIIMYNTLDGWGATPNFFEIAYILVDDFNHTSKLQVNLLDTRYPLGVRYGTIGFADIKIDPVLLSLERFFSQSIEKTYKDIKKMLVFT